MKVNKYRGDITDISAKQILWCAAVIVLSKLNKMFSGYFDSVSVMLERKNKHFSG